MTPGVSFFSTASTAAWAAITGAFDTNYPVGNLGDILRPSQVTRAVPSTGQVTFTFTLPAVQAIQFLALVRHNMTGSQSVRLRLFSSGAPDPVGNSGALVYDSGIVAVWPSGSSVSGYPGVRPFLLSASTNVASGRFDITGLAAPLEIGAVEIARFWTWPGEGSGRQFGATSRVKGIDLIGGGIEPIASWKPRVLTAEIPFLAMGVAQTSGLDFMKLQGLANPFVYVADYDDPTSWPRECALMRNSQLMNSVGQVYRHDKFQFRFIEHNR